mmetsp:Transcript_630/g.1920  ORF Transcript_630/g.1920 Transcript_630/m.1920 type:complete len:100 (-) Transcript_630:165-464(-)
MSQSDKENRGVGSSLLCCAVFGCIASRVAERCLPGISALLPPEDSLQSWRPFYLHVFGVMQGNGAGAAVSWGSELAKVCPMSLRREITARSLIKPKCVQ